MVKRFLNSEYYLVKTLTLLIVFLTSAALYAQHIEKPKLVVEYIFYDNLNYMEYDSKLIIGDSESIFETKYSKFNTDKPTSNGNVITLNSKLSDQYQYVNNVLDSLYSFETLDNKTYKVSEVNPKFNWNLNFSDTKKINNYTCNKATMEFRGRSYTAWFAPEIPYFIGPFKFAGLPGLILEIQDDTQTFKWSVTRLKFKNNNAFIIPYDLHRIELYDYMLIRTEHLEKLRARVRSVLPRGTQFNRPKDYRKGIEKVYEWEL